MSFSVRYKKSALKELKKMDHFESTFLISWIEKNLVAAENPRFHGKPLTGDYKGSWRYRAGKYRILAIIKDSELIIEIILISHRKNIY